MRMDAMPGWLGFVRVELPLHSYGRKVVPMRDALLALNQLVTEGVIEAYAIGGAVGASFYIQAMQTEDVDAFVFLPGQNSGLMSLTSVYESLVKHGGVVEREYVRFGSWPLQILPDAIRWSERPFVRHSMFSLRE